MFVSLTAADPDAPGKFLVAVREYVDPAGEAMAKALKMKKANIAATVIFFCWYA
jgi:hypothetical protein